TETFTETWSACTPGLAQFQRQGVDFLRPELEYYSDGAVIAVSQPTTVGNICRSDDRLPGYVTVYSTTCSDDSNPVDWRGYKVSAFSGGNIIPCPEDEYGLAIYDDSILLEELNGKLYLGYTFDLDDPEALVQNGFQNRVALKEVCGSTYPVDESDWSAELTFNWVYFNGEDGLPGYAGSLGLGHDPDEDILHLVSAGTLDDHDNPPLPLPEPFTFWHGELLP
ncbi:MAG TPA: hypothetical protein VEI97_19380, partial [bacterium]|nr:hypothetical protein [bacterium]